MLDATTIWMFREHLVKARAIEKLFARFDAVLTDRVISQWEARSSTPASCRRRSNAPPKKNEALLKRRLLTSHIHSKKPPNRPMPVRTAKANAKRSVARSAVEHVFAGQKHRMHLVVGTLGIALAAIRIGMAKLIYNLQRCAWLDGRAMPP